MEVVGDRHQKQAMQTVLYIIIWCGVVRYGIHNKPRHGKASHAWYGYGNIYQNRSYCVNLKGRRAVMSLRVITAYVRIQMVGLAGFEPTIPGTQNQNHTKLDHNPAKQHGNDPNLSITQA